MAGTPRGAPRTLYDKIWDAHVVAEDSGETILYVDLHLVQDATSPQAFAGLAAAARPVRRPDLALVVSDHSVPTERQARGVDAVEDVDARAQLGALAESARLHGIESFALADPRNGIAHVVGPEQGRSRPGMTIVCGDSHTSTHGAFGALAFGIGTSEAEHVLATQTIRQRKAENFRIAIEGALPRGTTAKDMALFVMRAVGNDGAHGCVVEYAGEAVRALSMEGRMTLCNMAVELGARTGLIAPDETTFAYLDGRPAAPRGDHRWEQALDGWKRLRSDPGAVFDREVALQADAIGPMVSWGTNPSQVVPIDGHVPDPADYEPHQRAGVTKALDYMGLAPGTKMVGIPIDRVFIGSCTNSRIEDLRAAAEVAKGRQVAATVRAMVVPGSGMVKRQAEAEGLDRIFTDAGFDWREPGCSMCVGMNGDRLGRGERCAATSNRNFENRQGPGGRTHLMSPAMAAAAAVTGAIADVRTL